jgi:hypothetical protein
LLALYITSARSAHHGFPTPLHLTLEHTSFTQALELAVHSPSDYLLSTLPLCTSQSLLYLPIDLDR